LERERIEREEEEKRLAEEKRQWLEVEGRRLQEEKDDLFPLLQMRAHQLVVEEAGRREQEEWHNFLACTHLPDVRNDADLSTYITLWREDPVPDIHTALKEAQNAIEVILGLEKLLAVAVSKNEEEALNKYEQFIKTLQDLILMKLDHATAKILENLDDHVTKDNICQIDLSTVLQKYGMWVNVAKNLRLKNIEYPSLGLHTDIPRPIILQTVAVRMMHFRKDILSSPSQAEDFFTIGGILYIEVLEVPDRPKAIKSHVSEAKDSGRWMIVKITSSSGDVIRQVYPPIDPVTGLVQTIGIPPMQVKWHLPQDVLLPSGDAPRLGWWEHEKKEWSDDGITDVSLESKDGERILSFSTLHLTTIAMLQSRWSCFPFQSWMLYPTGTNRAILSVDLNGDMTIKFEIGAGRCRLVWPEDESLKVLKEKPLPAMEMLKKMKFHGLNLIPIDEDAEKISTDKMDAVKCLKHRALEERACAGLSLLAPSFSLCQSPLNPTIGPMELLVRVSQTTDFRSLPLHSTDESFRTLHFREATGEEELSYCLIAEPKVDSAQSSEDGKIFDSSGVNVAPPAVGLETKFYPLTAIREIADESALHRCQESSASFTESVRVMLSGMRLLSFVKPPMKPDTPREEGGEEEKQEGQEEEGAEKNEEGQTNTEEREKEKKEEKENKEDKEKENKEEKEKKEEEKAQEGGDGGGEAK